MARSVERSYHEPCNSMRYNKRAPCDADGHTSYKLHHNSIQYLFINPYTAEASEDGGGGAGGDTFTERQQACSVHNAAQFHTHIRTHTTPLVVAMCATPSAPTVADVLRGRHEDGCSGYEDQSCGERQASRGRNAVRHAENLRPGGEFRVNVCGSRVSVDKFY